MNYVTPTTPFGQRPMSLAMMATQAHVRECAPDTTKHKWRLFRALTEAKDALGVSDRALAVLSALLSFHPETALTPGPDLVVFPSNRELGLRSHGMAPATLRRHLAALVEAGLLIRRDSPNGKRYARKDQNGEIEAAFGLDLSPLLARAAEIEEAAALARAERQACLRLREEITILRRDADKTIAAAREAALPGTWGTLLERLVPLLQSLPRAAGRPLLESMAQALRELRGDVDKLLMVSEHQAETSGNESRDERHYQNSNTDDFTESEPGSRKSQGRRSPTPEEAEFSEPPAAGGATSPFPLGMVLKACPDLSAYARHGIASWHDLVATAALVRGVLGISPDAWTRACTTFGETNAAVVVAAILQRAEAIRSPGGYLRRLTEKAEAGEFSLGPVLMALLRVQLAPRAGPGAAA